VEGGSFFMGRGDVNASDAFAGGNADEQPAFSAQVDEFWLDEYEVTVGRFRRYVEEYDKFLSTVGDNMGEFSKVQGSGWQSAWKADSIPTTTQALKSDLKICGSDSTWTDAPGSNEGKPINCVTWYQAFLFCFWDGGHLPTEKQWEYAAARGTKDRLYPWGQQHPDNNLAVFNCSVCGSGGLPVVGSTSLGQGAWGHQDLAGSVAEWVFDRYDETWYVQYSPGGCQDNTYYCANTNKGLNRVVRGGGYKDPPAMLRAAARGYWAPTYTNTNVGFRCAYIAP
jgi:formylglycine-generating enzyme required for sulfatase activity